MMAINPVAAPRGMPARRMLIALGASLLAHFLIIGGWGGSGAARTVVAVLMPLQARLEPMPAALWPSAEAGIAQFIAAPQPTVSSHRASPAIAPAPVVEQSPTGAAASGPGLRFYLARELDRYPSPQSALNLGSNRGAAGDVRLWVSIDQVGRVVDAAVIDADPSGESGRLARERVLATPFVPAQRDGRPVKSRVLLVLGQGV